MLAACWNYSNRSRQKAQCFVRLASTHILSFGNKQIETRSARRPNSLTICRVDTGRKDADPAAAKEFGRVFANMIHTAFRKNKLTVEMPSLLISAGLHAAFRWDKKRIFKPNDWHDFHHAVAAIPYCDYFLTEHNLRNLVADKNLKLGSLFKCQTFSDAKKQSMH